MQSVTRTCAAYHTAWQQLFNASEVARVERAQPTKLPTHHATRERQQHNEGGHAVQQCTRQPRPTHVRPANRSCASPLQISHQHDIELLVRVTRFHLETDRRADFLRQRRDVVRRFIQQAVDDEL